MSRSIQRFLIAGCAVIIVLQAPAALQSVQDGWKGAYSLEAPNLDGMHAAAELESTQADATAVSSLENSASTKKNIPPVLKAGF